MTKIILPLVISTLSIVSIGCFTIGDTTFAVNPIFLFSVLIILSFLIIAGITKLWGKSINGWLARKGSSYEKNREERQKRINRRF